MCSRLCLDGSAPLPSSPDLASCCLHILDPLSNPNFRLLDLDFVFFSNLEQIGVNRCTLFFLLLLCVFYSCYGHYIMNLRGLIRLPVNLNELSCLQMHISIIIYI